MKNYLILLILGLGVGSCSLLPEKSYQAEFSELDEMVDLLEDQGALLSQSLDSIAHFYEDHISNFDSLLSQADYDKYLIEGPFSSATPGSDSSKSSIIILNTTANREKALKEVAATNFLDERFSDFVKKNELVAQVYSNSALQVSRVYPCYDHKNIVDPNIDVTQFNFYYAANEINNPNRGLVWIPDAYVDPAGRGWIVSLVHPIYKNDSLFAVLGVDFTVDDVIYNYLQDYEGEYLLVNAKGDIVAGKAGAIETISMPPLKNHVYRETVKSENFRVSDFNLFQSRSREVREMAQEFLLKKSQVFEFQEEKSLKVALCYPFQEIDWYMIQIIPSN
ncbi:hypothetical protein Aoki45_08280 [Algoriphagus sp. oki45]|uniref:hypothetical protein n=1 Tax=Algoriphagus sp. oki45 TaxID=3067294 RepID=UPI0027EBE977|nr:hypothetical protein Aoki45_08280 [Algoriphagus sp. oki45]